MAQHNLPVNARIVALYAAHFAVVGNAELAQLLGMHWQTLNTCKKILLDGGWVFVDGSKGGRGTKSEVLPAYMGTPVTFTDVNRTKPPKTSYGLGPETLRKEHNEKIDTINHRNETFVGFPSMDITTRAPAHSDNINNIYNNNNSLLESISCPISEKPTSSTFELTSPEADNAHKPQKVRTNARKGSMDPDFEMFWAIYPRRDAKLAAERAFMLKKRDVGAAAIIEGARRYAADRAGQDPQYTSMASTWLNKGRWADAGCKAYEENGAFNSVRKNGAFFETQTGKEMVARLGREGAEARYLEILSQQPAGKNGSH